MTRLTAFTHGPLRFDVVDAGPGDAAETVLLLHGYPETRVHWRRVAPGLAERFTVVAPDIRGYGFSSSPPAAPGHAAYAKREMARDLVALMAGLGFERFRVASHDRGARVAHRLALDHPERVERLILPGALVGIDARERLGERFGKAVAFR